MQDLIKIAQNKLANVKNMIFYGVDLGTTYTVVARIDFSEDAFQNGNLPVKLVNIEQHSPFEFDGADKSEMIASVLGVNEEGAMFVGNKLYRLKGNSNFRKDVNLFYHWKLDLGVSVKPLYKDAVRVDIDDASKVAGKILNYCKLQLVDREKSWKNVTVTVPASFQANQRKDVLEAIRYAKIDTETSQLIDEPNEALLGYLNQLSNEEKTSLLHQGCKLILVVDFGGGTCDLSLLRLELSAQLELEISNLAISRYNDLGGQDIDLMIAEKILLPMFMTQNAEANFEDDVIENELIPQLAVIGEKLKIDLSQSIASRFININDIDESVIKEMSADLTQSEVQIGQHTYGFKSIKLSGIKFLEVMRHLFVQNDYKLEVVDKVIHSMPSVLNDIFQKANVTRDKIDYVLYAGGSVQNIIFIDETQQLLPNAQYLLPQRPDTLVAKGAAVYSFYKNGLGVELIKPINSETIGIVTSNAAFYPLVKSGTQLPASFDLPVFSLQRDNQNRIEIPFCVGKEDAVVQVLSVRIKSLLKANCKVEISGKLTINKILEVIVKVDGSLVADIVLVNPIMLANLSDENRKLTRSLIELEAARNNGNTSKESNLLNTLIVEYYQLLNYTRCISVCNEYLVKFDPTNATVLNYLYCSYHQLGQKRKANEVITLAAKHHPNNGTIQYNKSISIEEADGAKPAIDYLNSISDIAKNHNSVKFKRALMDYTENENIELSKIVAADYQSGKLNYLTDFDKGLLKRVLKNIKAEFNPNDFIEKKNTKNVDENVIYNNDGLLRVSDLHPSRE